MPNTTPRLGLSKPLGTEVVDISVINNNADLIDAGVAKKSDFDAHTSATDPHPQYATDTDLTTHKTATTLDHPDNSVTDAKIGNRTADPTQAPTGLVGTITQWLSWITNRIKSITGKANWYDAPATTLEAANTHMNNTSNPHNVTAAQVGAVTTATYNGQVNQDVRTTASPTFASLTVTGDITVNGGGVMKTRTPVVAPAITLTSAGSATLINYSGAGRLAGLWTSGSGQISVTVTLDGVTVLNNVNYSGTNGIGYNGSGMSTGSSTAGGIPAMDLQFKSSCVVTATWVGGTNTLNGVYEHE